VPIIALTADTHPDTREQVRLVGMNDFLSKPFRWPELEAALRRLPGLQPLATARPGAVAAALAPAAGAAAAVALALTAALGLAAGVAALQMTLLARGL
jgi:CheY-like chemotaxis protein